MTVKVFEMLSDMSGGIKESMFRPINKAASAILGLFSILWGFWVGNPWWEVFTQAEIFHVMEWVMPEWLWGVTAFLVGVSMLFGLIRSHFNFLVGGCYLGFYFWTFASTCFFLGDWKNTGGITLAMIALYSGYVALNLSINRDYYLEK